MSFNEGENQQQIELDSADSQTVKSCGAILFAERKRQNLSIEQISSEINLSETQIRALESDKYDILASASYVKGYIRLYANLLGLDVDEVLQYFKEPVQKQNTSLSNIGRGIHKTKPVDNSGLLKILLSIALIAGFGFLVWFAVNNANWSANNEEDSSVVPEPGSLSIDSKVSGASDKHQASIEYKSDPIVSVTSVGKKNLAMSFNDSAWVEIIDKDNKQIINKRYQVGEKLSVYAQPPVRIFISNVDAVNMQYNQTNYDLIQHRQGSFAKFILDKP